MKEYLEKLRNIILKIKTTYTELSPKRKKQILVIAKDLAILLIVIVFLKCCMGFGYASSESMEPTIITGDITIDNKLAYKFREPKRGDIITFKMISNDEEITFCKRVIGLPGETIQFADGYIYIDKTLLDENKYIDEELETNCNKTFKVPENSYFVLGDNRMNSYDSRYWEEPYVPIDNIISKVWFSIPSHIIFK